MLVPWNEGEDVGALKRAIDVSLEEYREQYAEYYKKHATADSPAMRDTNPAVVLIPGLGMFSFGKNRTEARIIGEFYTNAIHVMEGASLLAGDAPLTGALPQCARRWTRPAFACSGITLRCRRWKHFASSTGCWKRRNPPPAGGEGVEPADRAHRGRRENRRA